MSTITMHIGIDDTDSPRMGCTTYIASLLAEKLHHSEASFVDYPNLIRLNPNVPWKTRGNGALSLRFRCDRDQEEEIKQLTVDIVEKNSDLSHVGTEPGVVFYNRQTIPKELEAFAKRTIQGTVKMRDATKLIKTLHAEAVGFKSGRGIIGALAAIGETLTGDHTYELIAYRTQFNCGTKRQLHADSVFKMNKKTKPLTFNNVDPETKRILITPHGPDPILYGIRGESANIVKQAHKMLVAREPVERWTIFRTNQGTDAHLRKVTSTIDAKPFNPLIVTGSVCKTPQIIPKRHVVFTISDKSGQIDCAAYEPTGDLRKNAAQLMVGDIIEASGAVRPASSKHPVTMNLEKFKVLKLAKKEDFQNPLCPTCHRRLESMGKLKGFRCSKCGFRSSQPGKVVVERSRALKRKLYITSSRSQRHLTKPFSRYGLEKSSRQGRMISEWFWVNRSLSQIHTY